MQSVLETARTCTKQRSQTLCSGFAAVRKRYLIVEKAVLSFVQYQLQLNVEPSFKSKAYKVSVQIVHFQNAVNLG